MMVSEEGSRMGNHREPFSDFPYCDFRKPSFYFKCTISLIVYSHRCLYYSSGWMVGGASMETESGCEYALSEYYGIRQNFAIFAADFMNHYENNSSLNL